MKISELFEQLHEIDPSLSGDIEVVVYDGNESTTKPVVDVQYDIRERRVVLGTE